MARVITDVITQMRTVIPAGQHLLLGSLSKIEESYPYTAPEAQGLLWRRLSESINTYCLPVVDDWELSVVALLMDQSEEQVRLELSDAQYGISP